MDVDMEEWLCVLGGPLGELWHVVDAEARRTRCGVSIAGFTQTQTRYTTARMCLGCAAGIGKSTKKSDSTRRRGVR
jgi:hypothetical protein